jgi:hypothetical protein
MAQFGDVRSDKNALRHDANTLAVTGIEIDYDLASMPFDDAVDAMRAANVRCILYTSASYIAGVKEKWRILAPLSEAYPPTKRACYAAAVNGIIGGVAAGESFRISTAFYYGCVDNNPGHRVEVLDGDFIDQRPDLLAKGIDEKIESKKADGAREPKEPGVTPGYDDAEIEALLAKSRKIDRKGGGGNWHNSMLSVTASMVGKQWTDEAIYAKCAEFCNEGWGDKDLAEMVQSARKKWGIPNPGTIIDRMGPIVAAAIEAKGGIEPEFEPNWRERIGKKGVKPAPSLHNARLAILHSGFECSEDLFHNRMYIGRGAAGSPLEPLAPFLGEVNDGRLLSLRLFLSDRYGFDLTEKHIRDAVLGLARENAFDPVCDMLAEAELSWDGVERIDRMAVDYFNCEDTPLNRQCVRKTMVAAVARARRPGCKFDTILTMESKEGWNKSSSWRVLAGDENFSDASILGHSGREVQEQLGAIWVHEISDLAGLKKAEVETVKAFASRQEDRARPAYGRFLLSQPRRSIEIGTTNSSRYMHSPTGNRRFWPIKVLAAIDLAKLKKDRLQLWGEAAHLQSKGERLTLDKSLWEAAGDEQELRRVQHPWEALLETMGPVLGADGENPSEPMGTACLSKTGGEYRVHTRTIFNEVLKIPGGQLHRGHSMALAEVMKLHGWENKETRINKVVASGYVKTLVKITQ